MSIYGVLDAKAMGTNVGVTNGDATVTTSGTLQTHLTILSRSETYWNSVVLHILSSK